MINKILCLMGPTASGKTALAFKICDEFPCEIISVDSAMIYREMNIGTAKPGLDELMRYPHHLIDILNPDERYSAAQFCEDALALCLTIWEKGRLPLLVGGTMMYFNALQHGMAMLPETDNAIRLQVQQQIETQGLECVYQHLKEVDPLSAAKIHAHDTQRLSRALEVYLQTGVPISHYLAAGKQKNHHEFINVALFPQNRKWLHETIQTRFKAMIELGLIPEVQGLLKRWQLTPELPSMRCVGYRQVYDYLEQGFDLDTLVEKGSAATRQLAKRQLTWLRNWPDLWMVDPENPLHTLKIMEKIRYTI